MLDVTTGVTVFDTHPVSGSSVSIGLDPSADISFPPSEGHTYRFWIGAKNGSFPQLTDRYGSAANSLEWSTPVDILVTTPLPEFYCSTSPNSVNPAGALMNHGGTTSITANDFQLIAAFAPAGQPGLFYYGPNQIEAPFGNGFRCVSGAVTRLNPPTVISSPWGEAIHNLDNSSPTHAANIQAGTRWNFQFWYRDPADGGSNFNLTNALSVPFTP
jgi:hypothetical protein